MVYLLQAVLSSLIDLFMDSQSLGRLWFICSRQFNLPWLICSWILSHWVNYGIFAPGTFNFPDWLVHGIVTDDAQLLGRQFYLPWLICSWILSHWVNYGIFAPGTFNFPDWLVHGIVTDDAQLLGRLQYICSRLFYLPWLICSWHCHWWCSVVSRLQCICSRLFYLPWLICSWHFHWWCSFVR